MILPSVVSQENEEIYYKFEGDSITKKEFELSEVTVYNKINFWKTKLMLFFGCKVARIIIIF